MNVTEAQAAGVEGVAAAFGDRWTRVRGPRRGAPAGLGPAGAAGRGDPGDRHDVYTVCRSGRFMVPFNYADLPLVVVPARSRAVAAAARVPTRSGRGRSSSWAETKRHSCDSRRPTSWSAASSSSRSTRSRRTPARRLYCFGGALLTLTAVVAGAFFLVLVVV